MAKSRNSKLDKNDVSDMKEADSQKLSNNADAAADTVMEVKDMREAVITPRATDFSRWYLDVLAAAGLYDNSPVRGSMVIMPDGYAIWENIQRILDTEFKKRGVRNAYFPLLIPVSFLEKEAEHVEGFAKECAVVTHHRLAKDGDKLVPAGKLEEPFVIRPTSETIIYHKYAEWIKSFRDLPLVLNQWANVMRWEMRTRPFLRTTEFLWQEGHTVHATKSEADEMALAMLEVYRMFTEEYLAIPVIKGRKTETEKFAGADYTTTIETMMQDGKALQAATSHMLGQNFAKAFGIKYTKREGGEEYAWQTSWGITTRMIGALVMVHGDDKGIIVPPRIAATQVVIVPIWGKDDEREGVVKKAHEIAEKLKSDGLFVYVDDSDGRPGPKFYAWERKGVPLRLEIGPRDLASNSLIAVRRDSGEKTTVPMDELERIKVLLDNIQESLFKRALTFREDHTYSVDTYDELRKIFAGDGTGFVKAHWCGDARCEARVKEDTTATIRCIPYDHQATKGKCVVCGGESKQEVIFAKAY